MGLKMTDEQQYLFECLKDIVWDVDQLRHELEASHYQIFLNTESLGQFLISQHHPDDPLPTWAESFFNWNDFVKYGGYCNVYRLSDGIWLYIMI